MNENKLILDCFGTEIVPGESYYENEYNELIHPDNLKEYVLENDLLKFIKGY